MEKNKGETAMHALSDKYIYTFMSIWSNWLCLRSEMKRLNNKIYTKLNPEDTSAVEATTDTEHVLSGARLALYVEVKHE